MTIRSQFSSGGFAVLVLVLAGAASAQTPTDAPSNLSEKAEKGKAVYDTRCFICHDVDSERVRRIGPPALTGLFKKSALIGGKPVNDENVKEVIRVGPTSGMPGFRYTLSEEEIVNLVEFLKTK